MQTVKLKGNLYLISMYVLIMLLCSVIVNYYIDGYKATLLQCTCLIMGQSKHGACSYIKIVGNNNYENRGLHWIYKACIKILCTLNFLTSGCWNRGVPLYYMQVSGCWNRGDPLHARVSSLQGVGIEGFQCMQGCPHFRVLE